MTGSLCYSVVMPEKKPSTFKLTEEARELLRLIGERRGLNMTAALEVLIREKAERDGVHIPPQDSSKS